MSDRPVFQPSAAHPITITPTEGRVTVRVGGVVVAETDAALSLSEATYPAVQYVPLGAVDKRMLRRSSATTYCPYKGEASYYDVLVDGDRVADAGWSYEKPFAAVAAIGGYVAFYPEKAEITVG